MATTMASMGCLLCHKQLPVNRTYTNVFNQHMLMEHMVTWNLDFLLVMCLLGDEERKAIREVASERIKPPITNAPDVPLSKVISTQCLTVEEEDVPEVTEVSSSATIELFEDGVISFVEEVEVKNGDVEENMVIKQPENSLITFKHSDQGNKVDFVESRKTDLLIDEVVEDDHMDSKTSFIVTKDIKKAKDLANPISVLEDLDNILDGLRTKTQAVVKEESDLTELVGDSTKTVMDKLWQLGGKLGSRKGGIK